MISSNFKIVEKVVGVCQGILDIFSVHYFIDGYKVIDFANRCALRKICRPDPRSGAGARMDFIWFSTSFFQILLFLLYELEEIKHMRQPSVVTVYLSLRSF